MIGRLAARGSHGTCLEEVVHLMNPENRVRMTPEGSMAAPRWTFPIVAVLNRAFLVGDLPGEVEHLLMAGRIFDYEFCPADHSPAALVGDQKL
jgi:hypothetical protein